MLLKEILEDADLLVPNALSLQQKIRYFNQAQRQLYRDYPMPLKSDIFTTIPGVALYELSMQTDRVVGVYINDVEYRFKTSEDPEQAYVYTFMDDNLFIQPTPQTEMNGYLLYLAQPADKTAADLETEPSVLEDYHEIFVYAVAEKLAMVGNDYKTAAELTARYQNLANMADAKLQKLKIKKIRKVRRWA